VSCRKVYDKKIIGIPTLSPMFLAQENNDLILQENLYKIYLEESILINNLLTNGDFEEGNSGFTSDYTSPFDSNNGEFDIISDAQTIVPEWIGVSKIGTSFMAINGATDNALAVYKQIAVSVDTNTTYSFSGFLSNLKTIDPTITPEIEIRITGVQSGETTSQFFRAPEVTDTWKFMEILWQSDNNTEINLEIFCTTTNIDGNAFGLDNLIFATANIQDYGRVIGENIKTIRFTVNDAVPAKLELETYDNYIANINTENTWNELGNFGLSTDQNEVFNQRLEKETGSIHNKWQKYKGAKVNIDNYKSRWNPLDGPDDQINNGLKYAIEQYISLSDNGTNPKAEVESYPDPHGSTGNSTGSGKIKISYFDMLKIVSFDYHVARMLGLGHIDNEVSNDSENEYIYVAQYTSNTQLSEGTGINHIFSCAPINILNEKIPQAPILKDLEYGIIKDEGTTDALALTDKNGYTFDGKARYVNVHIESIEKQLPTGDFFESSEEFCYQGESEGVFVGLEYKTKGEDYWRKEVITPDRVYKDTDDNFEVSPLPFPLSEDGLIFKHKETNEGEHEYAVYSINWFSRSSIHSNTQITDNTEFVKPNKLLPPYNLQAQVIQPESNLVLTTDTEQTLLSNNPNEDKTLVRVTFDYSHTHDITHDFADKVQLFYRKSEPRYYNGGIKTVSAYNGSSVLSKVVTNKYSSPIINSTELVTSEAIIPSEEYSRFVGGVLTVKNKTFTIVEVLPPEQSGDGSIFIVQNIEERSISDDRDITETGTPNYAGTLRITDPTAYIAEPFTVIENMANVENWQDDSNTPTPLSTEILLTDLDESSPMWDAEVTETTVPQVWDETLEKSVPGVISLDEKVIQKIRGINDSATITQATEEGTSEIIPGAYIVTLNNKIHCAHPQNSDSNPVNWYKGSLRVHTAAYDITQYDDDGTTVLSTENFDADPYGQKKNIEVNQIISSVGEPLSLLVFDSQYEVSPIETGADIEVNYYPGYKAYCYVDTNAGLTNENVFPQTDESTRTTYLSARTVDTNNFDQNQEHYTSKMHRPVALHAYEIIEALPPYKPEGALFATRPDYYNKSTYTFKIKCQHKPYALAFYRSSERMILEALYEPATVIQIREDLAALGEDESFTSRWMNLVDFDTLFADDSIGTFPPTDGYRFPVPDKAKDRYDRNLFDGISEPSADIEKYKKAIYSAFLPLTEQPLIYGYMNSGVDYVPTNKKQVVRDQAGNMLDPSDIAFDQAPMAKIVNTSSKPIIQFTDFTLDGAAKNFYFYYGIEINDLMQFSEQGPISGPIQLVNTSAPNAPKITSIKTQVEDVVQEIPTAVKITVSNYPEIQGITKFQIYRAEQASNSATIRTMNMVKEVDLENENLMDAQTIEIIDNFSFENFVPYGDPLFYKVIGLRKINYATPKGVQVIDYVPSLGSKTVLANIVDTVNPEAPELTFTKDEVNSTETEIIGGKLTWAKVVHNATYYVYKMNDSGNWNLLHSFKKNDDDEISFDITQTLSKVDEDGEPIYHRFKVDVENSSGLFNFNDNTITI
jgi:hypothetical protein